VIDWQVPGNELRDNPVVRQAPPGRVKAGEVRRHATGDPSLLMPGDNHSGGASRRVFLHFRQVSGDCFGEFIPMDVLRSPVVLEAPMNADISEAVHGNGDGVIITVEVSAGSKTDSFPSGYNSWRKAIGCTVRATPTGGKANAAVTDLIADTLGLPRTGVSLVSGSRSHQKKICITGVSAEYVLQKIAVLLASRNA